MKSNTHHIHPYVRLFFVVSTLIATILTTNILLVCLFYAAVILPLLLIGGQVKAHLRFLIVGILPVFFSFVLINIVILHGENGGWSFIFVKMVRLLVYATVFQVGFTIPSSDLLQTLRMWKIRGNLLIISLSSFTVFRELATRAEKIVTARLSRGYFGKRNPISLAIQLPYVMNPLIIGVMRTSIERADSWDAKNMLIRLEQMSCEPNEYGLYYNAFILVTPLLYTVTTFFI